MRKAQILYKDEDVGILTQNDEGSFTFEYRKDWVENTVKPSISLTLPKRIEKYESKYLFPFFFNMLPEGSNKQVVCRYSRIDLDDYFSLLMITAKSDTIGAVRVVKIKD